MDTVHISDYESFKDTACSVFQSLCNIQQIQTITTAHYAIVGFNDPLDRLQVILGTTLRVR